MRRSFRHVALAAVVILAAHGTARAVSQPSPVIQSGHLRCAVVDEALDWNKTDLHGNLSPMDIEICHAVAAALFGDSAKVDLQSYHSEEEGLVGLQKGLSDIVVGVTPNSRSAEKFAVRYSVPFFQDAQGFMVNRHAGIRSLADINGHQLCTIDDTDNDPIAFAMLAHRGVRPIPFGFQEEGEMDAAIMDRHCQVASAYLSKLAEVRGSFPDARDFVFLPETITLSPVTIAVPATDPRLSAVVDYAVSALLQAEDLGISKANIGNLTHSDDPRVQRLTGEDWSTADGLGLPHDWSRRMIAETGNYAEIYNATIGPGTPLNLPRGLNALWSQGGILAPLPLQ